MVCARRLRFKRGLLGGVMAWQQGSVPAFPDGMTGQPIWSLHWRVRSERRTIGGSTSGKFETVLSLRWRARRDSNSRPLPSEDCGSCVCAPIFKAFRDKGTRNATKTLRDYADNLRTPADAVSNASQEIGMMVSIDVP